MPATGARDYGVYSAHATPTAIISPLTCTTLKIEWDAASREYAEKWTSRLTLMRDCLRDAPDIRADWPTSRKPMRHQLQALGAIRHLDWRALLADDMGLGKSSTALWSAWLANADRLLIVCPVSAKWNWKDEIAETLGEWNVTILDGSAKERANQLADYRAAPKPRALILNYDLIVRMSDQQLITLSDIATESFVILDESHYIKNVAAARTKKLSSIVLVGARALLLLSGTPMRNFASDLFPQVEALRPFTWTSYSNFLERYVEQKKIRVTPKREQWVPARNKNMPALNAIISTLQVRRTKSECLKLPPTIESKPLLTFDPSMEAVYAAMAQFARIELSKLIDQSGGDAVIWQPWVRTGAMTELMRCEQIAQGFLGGVPEGMMGTLSNQLVKYADKIPGRPGELIFPQSAKIVWLLEAIEAVLAQGGRPVVMSRFNAPLYWLRARLAPLRCEFLHGDLPSIEKDEAVRRFQAGDASVFLCQVRMAEGFNLTSSQDVLFFGRDWSPAINAQAVARLSRMGQRGTVNVQIPVVRKTVDEWLDKKLNRKDADAASALATVTLSELVDAL